MSTIPLHFKVIYRNGGPAEIADFYRNQDGKFIFNYRENPQYEFPGFALSERHFESETLWEQISIRIPNTVRSQYPGTSMEELLKVTQGKLVTDHFEFIYINSGDSGSLIKNNFHPL